MHGVAWRSGCDVVPVLNGGGVIKVLVKGVDVFEHGLVAADAKVVDRHNMLAVFGEADTADMLKGGGHHQ